MKFGIRQLLIRWLAGAVLGIIVLNTDAAYAQRGIAGSGTTPQEMGLLPAYCPHAAMYTRIYGSPEGHAMWLAKLGKDFEHIHHYCWALVALQRANRASTTKQERNHYLQSAEGDIGYVIRYSSESFVLLPEMYLRRGQVRIRRANERDAVDDFRRAIQLRPGYSPPYVELAEVFKRHGRLAEARKMLERGLEHAPDSKYLRYALARLGAAPKGDRDGESAHDRSADTDRSAEKQAAEVSERGTESSGPVLGTDRGAKPTP